jgi:hypothetical protein
MLRIPALSLIAAVVFFTWPMLTTAQESTFPQIAGWKLAPEETVYTTNNLFDVIDGAADLYLEYDFVDLHIARYTKEKLEIKVEIYRHASSENAFGIFSQERFADYHFIDLGVQGYMEKGIVNFLTGIFYVKISTIQEGTAAQDAILMIAKAVDGHLKQSKDWPAMLVSFPAAKKKAYSEQYVAKSFLGYSALNGVYVSAYENGSSFKAFVIKFGTPEEASKTLDSFVKALPKTAMSKEIRGIREIQDPNNGQIEIVLKGNFLFGVVCAEVGTKHDAFLNEFGQKLSSDK